VVGETLLVLVVRNEAANTWDVWGVWPRPVGAATTAAIAAHATDTANPHTVTKTQVGLGSVPDVDFTASVAAALAAAAASLQPAAIGTTVQAYDADLTAWAGKTAPTGDAVGTTDAQTITNKRDQPRVVAAASTATLTPSLSTGNVYVLTAQATALTIAAPTGSPATFEPLLLRITDNGTARALTWNAAYRASAARPLPSTTVIGQDLYVTLVRNTSRVTWDAIDVISF
jgi:hypothetical protein